MVDQNSEFRIKNSEFERGGRSFGGARLFRFSDTSRAALGHAIAGIVCLAEELVRRRCAIATALRVCLLPLMPGAQARRWRRRGPSWRRASFSSAVRATATSASTATRSSSSSRDGVLVFDTNGTPTRLGRGARGDPHAHRSAGALDRQLALALGSLVRHRNLPAGLPRRPHRLAREEPAADGRAGARVQQAVPRGAAARPTSRSVEKRAAEQAGAQAAARGRQGVLRAEEERPPGAARTSPSRTGWRSSSASGTSRC